MPARGGIIQLTIGGEVYDAKSDFDYNLGLPVREAIVGVDGVHDYKEVPQPAFVEGEITDRGSLNHAALVQLRDVTVALRLANGKTILLSSAWYAGEGGGNTGEGAIKVRFESRTAVEVPA
jgi:hypothetical protein